jgi:hypothetical protein
LIPELFSHSNQNQGNQRFMVSEIVGYTGSNQTAEEHRRTTGRAWELRNLGGI